jgi:hypothetical protein
MDNLEPEDELTSPAERAAVALIILCACAVAWITAFVALKGLIQ